MSCYFITIIIPNLYAAATSWLVFNATLTTICVFFWGMAFINEEIEKEKWVRRITIRFFVLIWVLSCLCIVLPSPEQMAKNPTLFKEYCK